MGMLPPRLFPGFSPPHPPLLLPAVPCHALNLPALGADSAVKDALISYTLIKGMACLSDSGWR